MSCLFVECLDILVHMFSIEREPSLIEHMVFYKINQLSFHCGLLARHFCPIGRLSEASSIASRTVSYMILCFEKTVKGVGGLSHKRFRRFINERRNVEAHNFLDGDLIESFLDLRRDKMSEVSVLVGVSIEDLCKTIEDLSRLH